MTPQPDLPSLDSPEKDALIGALIARIDALVAENTALRTRVAELEAKLGLPPKTPDNSSTPPSQGRKPSDEAASKPKGKPHAGAHRPLHPTPTARRDMMAAACQHCGADVSGVAQIVCEAYDHVEIPEIKPDITRVTLFGGTCPCCAKRFKATPPQRLEPGSPFGPNLRAFVIYLRFTQGISFERLAKLLSDILGLDISEGALVNMLEAARHPFATQTSLIRARLLSGTALESDETGVRVGKRNWWLWVFHHKDSAVFVADPSRGKNVVSTFLGDFRPDFWVSDRYGGQLGWAEKENQICLAHFIRDVQYAIDAGDSIFAPPASPARPRLPHRPATRAAHGCDPEGLCRASRGSPRRTHGSHADACGRRQAPAHRQEDPAASVRLRHQSRHPNDQQRLRAGVTSLRRVPENHQRFSHRMGRETLCRYPLHHRNRPPPRHRSAPSHPPHDGRYAAPEPCLNRTLQPGG
jgi:transposase